MLRFAPPREKGASAADSREWIKFLLDTVDEAKKLTNLVPEAEEEKATELLEETGFLDLWA
jgi:hypothetical protein